MARPPRRPPLPAWIALAWLTTTALPAPSGPAPDLPLPEVAPLKRQLVERAQKDVADRLALRRHHTFTQTRIREERSPNGTLRSRDVRRVTHRPASVETGDPQARDRAYEDRDIQLTEEVLSRFEFAVRGREQLRDRWLLRVDFAPRPGELPAPKLIDRFINRTAGTLWLDESSAAIVHARLRLLEKVPFVGGLVGVVYALECTLDRETTQEGLWYTRLSRWRVDYRQFFTHKIVDFEERREDVGLAAAPSTPPQLAPRVESP